MINTIIFDFGGVLGSDSDTIFFKVLIRNRISKAKASKIWNEHWPKLKIGEEHVDSIWNSVEGCTNVNIDKIIREYDKSISINYEVLALCKSLKQKGYKLGILANESSYWMDIKRRKGRLEEIFDVVYSSADINCPKPVKESYERILAELDSKPTETLFVDNMERNIKAAKSLGIKSILYKDINYLRRRLKDVLSNF